MRALLAYLLPALGDILWIGIFLGVIGLGPRMMNIDGDLGRHLTMGRYILDHGQVPTHDLFSHTMTGQPLIPHEWLSQVLFALAKRWMGLDGVVLLSALVISLAFWLVYHRARRQSQNILFSLAFTILAVAASSLHWLTRPHLFTFLLLAFWLDRLDRLRAGNRHALWQMPLIMLLWANLHGAFIAGFVCWAIYGIGCAWDQFFHSLSEPVNKSYPFWWAFLGVGAASLLATFINPAGLHLWGTSLGYIGNHYLVSHTAEYLPPDFQNVSTWPFALMVAGLVIAFGLQVRRVSAAHLFLSAAWLIMALYSVRNAPLFAIVVAPILAQVSAAWLAEQRVRARLLEGWAALDQRLSLTESKLRGALWPLLMVVLVTLGLRSGAALDFQQAGNRFDAQVFPIQAVDWISTHPVKGSGFNYFPWGGYLLYRLWPDQLVFIDGQTDFYGEQFTRQYEQVLTLSPGWEEVLQEYQVQWVLMPPEENLSRALLDRPGWQVAYRDEQALLFVAFP